MPPRRRKQHRGKKTQPRKKQQRTKSVKTVTSAKQRKLKRELTHSRSSWHCTYCMKEGAAARCSSCKVFYCDKECQRADWPKHKLQCVHRRRQAFHQRFGTVIPDPNKPSYHELVPRAIFSRTKFVNYCCTANSYLDADIASCIYSFLTAYETTFRVNGKHIDSYHPEYWKQMLSIKLNERGGDWRLVQGYAIQIMRDDNDTDYGDVVQINVGFFPCLQKVPFTPCLVTFRAKDIMAKLNGVEYAKLIQLVLDAYSIPYHKFRLVGLSHSISTNDVKFRRDLLQTLLDNVCGEIATWCDFWNADVLSVDRLYPDEFEKECNKSIFETLVKMDQNTDNETPALCLTRRGHQNDRRNSRKMRVCLTCKRVDCKLKLCARCRTELYCSRKCQKIRWKMQHRFDCARY